MKRGKRKLNPEEQELWARVTETAIPMPVRSKAKIADQPIKTKVADPVSPRPIKSFKLGERAASKTARHNLAPSLDQHLVKAPVAMDKKAFTRLKQGKLSPEARLDLHGMTLDQAHPRLNRFILDAHAQGKRLVLVITGKGKSRDDNGPIPTRLGVLRHQVPNWFQQHPLKPHILQVTQASQKHGGSGAYYVYLRRAR
ncbi:DNA-nicking Smr family endonuclease [Litoreibacter meonggei]|uniref:DNA-nicking Smr family endonuclease n=1 Tax=Litoreibacter meonggei TaxID=1049199 RepID=A0A497W7B2_9RHOB|nr:Smr/MutS family protein [Litoreibacter meonggei]RLJ52090.1 DNA-nicking Smr family endonuclease [Litoreibacter meonggei]